MEDFTWIYIFKYVFPSLYLSRFLFLKKQIKTKTKQTNWLTEQLSHNLSSVRSFD